MVNLYEGLIVAAEVSPRSADLSKSAHSGPRDQSPFVPVSVQRSRPPPRRSAWVTSREHFGGPLSPPRINLWPRKREGDCLCSHALGGLPTTFLRVLHCLHPKRTLPIFGERDTLPHSLFARLFLLFYNEPSLIFFLFPPVRMGCLTKRVNGYINSTKIFETIISSIRKILRWVIYRQVRWKERFRKDSIRLSKLK